ncbi:hypothetical protein, partial [Hydrogenophaga sp.]|uniref:hypothetical protein n=1 Tax=Hydrogenophaga sp. TaxID=1904254 RepID=UPI0027200DB0
MISRVQITLTLLIALAGCATVRQADLDAWVGQPIVALETHPVFLTIPVVKTVASEAESFSTLTAPIMPVAYHAERADMRTNGIADVRGERLWLDQEPYL